jgi:hypothetical protein
MPMSKTLTQLVVLSSKSGVQSCERCQLELALGEVVVSKHCAGGRRKYYCKTCFVDARGKIIAIPMSKAAERLNLSQFEAVS